MLKIENTETYGWEAAVRGMRNPMNSWDKSDSYDGCLDKDMFEIFKEDGDIPKNAVWTDDFIKSGCTFVMGDSDIALTKKLAKAGADHRKFMRMITVYCDITAPLYWWKEMDQYRIGQTTNSCSTMHKIHAKEFELDDFSHEHVIDFFNDTDTSQYIDEHGAYNFDSHPIITLLTTGMKETYFSPLGLLKFNIEMLNKCRNLYLETKDKKYWWQMIQLLPSSYNQKRTVMLNYEVLANIYKSRKGHRLDEWKTMLDWIETLPYSELITGKEE